MADGDASTRIVQDQARICVLFANATNESSERLLASGYVHARTLSFSWSQRLCLYSWIRQVTLTSEQHCILFRTRVGSVLDCLLAAWRSPVERWRL
jgi:hypothetical protein